MCNTSIPSSEKLELGARMDATSEKGIRMMDSSQPQYVDYIWLGKQFEVVCERLAKLEGTVNAIGQNVASADESKTSPEHRAYYSVQEFAAEVDRAEYTVREWCRYERIHAEKCDSGRGEAKSWKIPVEELQRYRDHGLLPATYPR